MVPSQPRSLQRGHEQVPWPALLDLITSTLMVFLLVTYLQMALTGEDLEAILARNQQERFLQLFRSEFAGEIGHGVVATERYLDFLQITFSDRVLFASGDHRLQPAGRALLSRCAALFARARDTGYGQIQVEGHTDDRPLHRAQYPMDNWELSTARALSVVEFLSGPGGVPPRSFSASGYGAHRPAASNRTDAGRARNRRIEIRLFFSGSHAAAASRRAGLPRPPSP
jgi:chemotaxis protein MotB